MNSSQLNDWTRHYAFDVAARERLSAVVEALGASAPRGKGSAGFEVAVNDRDRFEILKLIHVGDNERQPGAGTASGATRVRSVVRAIEASGTGTAVEAASGVLREVWSALADAGLDGWYPTVGLEFRAPDLSLEEVSLYSHYRPVEVARVVTAALEVEGAPLALDGEPFAFGFDVISGSRPRAEVYRILDADGVAVADRGWGTDLRPRTILGLQRTPPGVASLLPSVKAYAHFGDLPVERLSGRITDDRAARLWSDLSPKVVGMVIAFVAVGSDKVEFYLEQVRASPDAMRTL